MEIFLLKIRSYTGKQQNAKESSFSQQPVDSRGNNSERKGKEKQGKQRENVDDDGFEKIPSRRSRKQKCQQRQKCRRSEQHT